MSLKEKLIGVKEALVKHGRNDQGLMIDSDGCLCLLGGVAVSVYGEVEDTSEWYTKLEQDPEAFEVVKALAEQIDLPTYYDPGLYKVFWFNDTTPLYRDEEVFAVIDAAIEAADA